MSLSTTALTPVIDANSLVVGNAAAKVFEMESGTITNKNDIDYNNQRIENQVFTLNDVKYAKTGGVITGTVTITPSGAVAGLIVSAGAASDQTAVQGTGNGIGQGAVFAGGINGAGGTAQAGGGNNFGWRAFGAGTEAGGEFTGGPTGTGVKATAGTAATTTAPTIASDLVSGGMRMTTVAAPNADVNPGADATIWPQNIISSTGIFESDGAGGYVIRNNKGLNIASVSGDAAGVATITFVRNLLGNDYRMHLDAEDGYDARWNGEQNVSGFQFVVRNATTNVVVDLTTTAVTVSVSTVGF